MNSSGVASDGSVYIAYFEPVGVAQVRYANGQFDVIKRFDSKSTATTDKVFSLGLDSEQRLWIGGGKGMDLVTPARVEHFGARDGLVGEDMCAMSFFAEANGDVWFGTTKGLVRSVKNFPFTGSAANGFSEVDLGGDIGGPIVKDKVWFFGAFNPQRRTNYYLTQTFHAPVQNKVTIPFYAGKLTWALNSKNTLTGSTFGDFTKVDGFLATGALQNANGFGNDISAFTLPTCDT